MFRRFLVFGTGVLALLGGIGLPGPLHAQSFRTLPPSPGRVTPNFASRFSAFTPRSGSRSFNG